MDTIIVIYTFESFIPTEAITNIKKIPSDFSIIKKYFNNINVKLNGGHTWFQVWLGYNESSENLLTNMKHGLLNPIPPFIKNDYNTNILQKTISFFSPQNV